MAVLALAGCTSMEGSPVGTGLQTPAPTADPTAAFDPIQDENTRRLLAQHIRAFERRLDDGVPRTLRLLDSPFNQSSADDAKALVRLAEDLTDWIADERDWLADAARGPCVSEAVELYDVALTELEVVVDRLLDAPLDAGSAGVRASEANEDAAMALADVGDALPDDCTP